MIIDEKYIQRPHGLSYREVHEAKRIEKIEKLKAIRKVEKERDASKRQGSNHDRTSTPAQSSETTRQDQSQKSVSSTSSTHQNEEEWVNIPKHFYEQLLKERDTQQQWIDTLRSAFSFSVSKFEAGSIHYTAVLDEKLLREIAASLIYREQNRTLHQAASFPLRPETSIQIDQLLLRSNHEQK